MSGASYKIETECHCKPGDAYRCQIHDKDPVIRAAAWQYRCELAERQAEEWHSAETFMAEQAALERARASKAESALAESEARRATLEREANAYLGAIGGLKWERDDAEARRAEADWTVRELNVALELARRDRDAALQRAEAAESVLANERAVVVACTRRAEAAELEASGYQAEIERQCARALAAERSLAAAREDVERWKAKALREAEKNVTYQHSLDRAVEVLRQVEWMGRAFYSAPTRRCPKCQMDEATGHLPGCALAAVLGGGR